ncbi:MAG: hypothetical protein HGA70_10245 [Chlorobiaceae bacterium]|nr:hypothetical protein [Chlorobiaceae bacterium]
MKHLKTVATAIFTFLVFSGFATAQTNVTAHGWQTRGTVGQNAKIHGDLFSLPSAGTVSTINGSGAGGFWIEKASGELVVNFNTLGEANGYQLGAGSYRAIPNLKDGANSASIDVTFICP